MNEGLLSLFKEEFQMNRLSYEPCYDYKHSPLGTSFRRDGEGRAVYTDSRIQIHATIPTNSRAS